MKLVFIGYITGPFGLNGEVKIVSETNYKNEIFKVGNNLYIGGSPYKIISTKKNNKYEIIGFENINSIEKTDFILKKEVYVNKNEINISSYLIGELPLASVYDNKVLLGKVSEVLYNKNCTYIKVNNLIIPLIDNFIEKIDINKSAIYVKNIGDLNEN